MDTVELKNSLIEKINVINDKAFLNAIKTILDTKSDEVIYKTSPAQQKKIKEGMKQISKGEVSSNEKIQERIDQWLNEK